MDLTATFFFFYHKYKRGLSIFYDINIIFSKIGSHLFSHSHVSIFIKKLLHCYNSKVDRCIFILESSSKKKCMDKDIQDMKAKGTRKHMVTILLIAELIYSE